MPKYLFQGSYTLEGVKGLLKDGGSRRRAAAQHAVESVGGKVEAFYFTFGKDDVVLLLDAPDNVSVAAVSLAVAAAGGFAGRTTVLLTPEEIDQATKKAVSYRAPGQ
ncbi:MAG: GYD domain-containing protein [Armatimonadota bacterium]|nr:GYD domain-containing protein [Armatimonadota bacterium]MDR7454021.1 GYD domain-containing protein [Armatimonadota bacterium]MDR7456110.1 GYD domain-containing protein [Armatimonadota bacterium]MDR7497600.1 GYD domain-containing protein [Armatimonadota bacterium]MDR7512131.1 GYD domain-containing protein [Armatimonadota bacterium]